VKINRLPPTVRIISSGRHVVCPRQLSYLYRNHTIINVPSSHKISVSRTGRQ